METIKSKFVIWSISNNRIKLCDQNYGHHPFSEKIWEDVTITFNDNDSITMEGDEFQYGFELHDEYLKEFDYKVHPDYIDKTKFTKMDIVRRGWHRKLENKHKKVIMKNYTIIQ